ncbi:MAG: hypothetical protein KF858_07310 [Candidatus Sumerlaeia bacterium]|nr:hypothetical protein [Candidatus Sumerlaeia bacterium]
MLLVPYLSEEKLAELEVARLSAVDLCGNGAVYIDGVLTVYRTGRRNLFPASAPIKNVYRRNSSLVPRVLLSCPRFAAVQEVWREINARNPMVQCQSRTPMSLATVSKVLKSLEEDLTVDRSEGIRLLQPARLLDRLSANYEPPAIRSRRAFKLDESPEAIAASLAREAAALALPVQATGLSSVNRFAVMQRSELMSVYCPEPDALAARLNARETDRFPNLELLETEDERVYFDGEEDGEFRWASALQVWLELMTGDKRDRETADQVREVLLGRTPEGAP